MISQTFSYGCLPFGYGEQQRNKPWYVPPPREEEQFPLVPGHVDYPNPWVNPHDLDLNPWIDVPTIPFPTSFPTQFVPVLGIQLVYVKMYNEWPFFDVMKDSTLVGSIRRWNNTKSWVAFPNELEPEPIAIGKFEACFEAFM